MMPASSAAWAYALVAFLAGQPSFKEECCNKTYLQTVRVGADLEKDKVPVIFAVRAQCYVLRGARYLSLLQVL